MGSIHDRAAGRWVPICLHDLCRLATSAAGFDQFHSWLCHLLAMLQGRKPQDDDSRKDGHRPGTGTVRTVDLPGGERNDPSWLSEQRAL